MTSSYPLQVVQGLRARELERAREVLREAQSEGEAAASVVSEHDRRLRVLREQIADLLDKPEVCLASRVGVRDRRLEVLLARGERLALQRDEARARAGRARKLRDEARQALARALGRQRVMDGDAQRWGRERARLRQRRDEEEQGEHVVSASWGQELAGEGRPI